MQIVSAIVFVNPLLALRWRHYERDGVSNHPRLDRLLDRLLTGGFPSQRAYYAENHYDDVIKSTMRLKSPASRLFTQSFI